MSQHQLDESENSVTTPAIDTKGKSMTIVTIVGDDGVERYFGEVERIDQPEFGYTGALEGVKRCEPFSFTAVFSDVRPFFPWREKLPRKTKKAVQSVNAGRNPGLGGWRRIYRLFLTGRLTITRSQS